jgi:nucleoside-diphosphate-sugar epimerase
VRTLVIGGTGPSGVQIVRGLLAAGDEVTILHTGQHETPLPGEVRHLHADPRDLVALTDALRGRDFDRAVSTSGRVRHVVAVLAGRVGRLVAIGGLPAYAAYAPGVTVDFGGPLPLREDDPRTPVSSPDRHAAATARSELTVLDAHARGDFEAVILRYTMVYGPYSYIPFEWYFTRRALDGRRSLVLESDGLGIPQRGHARNLAHGVLLALTVPEAAGEVFNIGDERCLTVRGIADEIAAALGHEWAEIVSVPLAMSPCGNPFVLRQHSQFDMAKARALLGYRDVVDVVAATRAMALWLRDHPPAPGGQEELTLGHHAFDYAREDSAIEAIGAVAAVARRDDARTA